MAAEFRTFSTPQERIDEMIRDFSELTRRFELKGPEEVHGLIACLRSDFELLQYQLSGRDNRIELRRRIQAIRSQMSFVEARLGQDSRATNLHLLQECLRNLVVLQMQLDYTPRAPQPNPPLTQALGANP